MFLIFACGLKLATLYLYVTRNCMSRKVVFTIGILVFVLLAAGGGYWYNDYQKNVRYREALAEQQAYWDAHPEEAAAEAERIANLPPVVTPEPARYEPTPSGDRSGELLTHISTFDLDVFYPDQYVDKMGSYSGRTEQVSESCKARSLFSNQVTCEFNIGVLHEKVPLVVQAAAQHQSPPSGEVRITTGEGPVRVYMPFYGVYKYIVVQPGETASLGGSLDRHPRMSGDLRKYALWVEAVEGEAHDVHIDFRPSIDYEDFGQ